MAIQEFILSCRTRATNAGEYVRSEKNRIQDLPEDQRTLAICKIASFAFLGLSLTATFINGIAMFGFGLATIFSLIHLHQGRENHKLRDICEAGMIVSIALAAISITINYMSYTYFAVGVGLFLFTKLYMPPSLQTISSEGSDTTQTELL